MEYSLSGGPYLWPSMAKRSSNSGNACSAAKPLNHKVLDRWACSFKYLEARAVSVTDGYQLTATSCIGPYGGIEARSQGLPVLLFECVQVLQVVSDRIDLLGQLLREGRLAARPQHDGDFLVAFVRRAAGEQLSDGDQRLRVV